MREAYTLILLSLLAGSNAINREPASPEVLSFEVESGGNLVRREGLQSAGGPAELIQEGEVVARTTDPAVKASEEEQVLSDTVKAVQELFDEGEAATTTTASDSIEDLEKFDVESELSGSDRAKIAAKVHEQMQDKAREERGSAWTRWDQVEGNHSNASSATDLLWSHEHKECLEPEHVWTPSMTDQARTDEPDHISCRARCLGVQGCSHWSYYLGGGSCYLQNASATKTEGKGAVSGIPGCRDKDPSIHLGMNAGGQACYHLSGSFIPLDMPEQKRTKEASYDLCQARCLETRGCAKFTYFILDQGCHLQENSSHMVFLPGTISGASHCDESDKAKFDAYLKQLPIMQAAQSMEPPCEDSWVSFIPFDLPGDLDEPGDITKDHEVKCETLYDHKDAAHVCKHSSQVRVRCPKLCGTCGIEKDAGGCADLQKDEHPHFLMDNHTLACSSLEYACKHDEEVAQKCKGTCGLCTTTTTSIAVPEVDHLAKVTSCSRRRSMGYCFTRRRRLF
mmetsp:Transcript_31195/g.58557  ORF Transcript_31195/g.58557 Transcript_31195/m.58557 type:complete len:509 (+) Transcript_31195:111-1637(+)